MIFTPTAINGVFLVEPEWRTDERGRFTRTYSQDEFVARGLGGRIAQCSASVNTRAGTLRGMHYQAAPHEETKLVRCTRGAIFDVAVDLRPGSPSFRRWHGTELSAVNALALYIPEGCAHGFQTLEDDSEILYQISSPYAPDAGRGVRWDDPAFGIVWPEVTADGRIMSARDATYPDFAG